MRTTGAVRAFTDAPVDDATLYRVLDRARFAPSGGNRQPWRVVVVKDAEISAGSSATCRQLGWREYVAFVEAGEVPFAPGADGRPNRSDIDLDAARATPQPVAVRRRPRPGARRCSSSARTSRASRCSTAGFERQSIIGGGSIYPFVQNLLLSARNEGLGGRHDDVPRPPGGRRARRCSASRPTIALAAVRRARRPREVPEQAQAPTGRGVRVRRPTRRRRRSMAETGATRRSVAPGRGGARAAGVRRDASSRSSCCSSTTSPR